LRRFHEARPPATARVGRSLAGAQLLGQVLDTQGAVQSLPENLVVFGIRDSLLGLGQASARYNTSLHLYPYLLCLLASLLQLRGNLRR
jgi:hypothetical protein